MLKRLLKQLLKAPNPDKSAEESAATAPPDQADRERTLRIEALGAVREGTIAFQGGKIEAALNHFQNAYAGFTEAGDRRSAPLCQKVVTLLCSQIKDPDIVRRTFQRTRDRLERAGMKDEVARILCAWGRYERRERAAASERMDFKGAETAYKESKTLFITASKIFHTLGQTEEEALAFIGLSELEGDKGNTHGACKWLQDALEIARACNFSEIVARAEADLKANGVAPSHDFKTAAKSAAS